MTCSCGRSPVHNCIGWHKLTHSEWQTKKLICEVKLKADLASIDRQQFLQKNPSYNR